MGQLSFLKAFILFCAGIATGFLLATSNDHPPTIGPGSVGFAPFVDQAPLDYRPGSGSTERLVALEAQPGLRVPLEKAATTPKPEGGPYIAVSELVETMGAGWITKEHEGAEVTGPEVEGIRHGKSTVYHPATGAREEGVYFLGARHGKWTSHGPDGAFLQEHQYFGGKRNGETRFRSNGEDSWHHATYRNGELVQDD